MISELLQEKVLYAHTRGLCGDIGPFRHLCTRWWGHKGKHNGVIQEPTDGPVYAAWGDDE